MIFSVELRKKQVDGFDRKIFNYIASIGKSHLSLPPKPNDHQAAIEALFPVPSSTGLPDILVKDYLHYARAAWDPQGSLNTRNGP